MLAWLRREGYAVNGKRVRRLLRLMGLMALYPTPRTTQRHPAHRIYPYLLRGVAIRYVHQVWSSDITYIALRHGFMYLVVVLDWFSRYVLAWRLSNTLDGLLCQQALRAALQVAQPATFNSDQGVQFTALAFTQLLQERAIRISMDGRGRAFDNIFNERLWRSLKYEDIYLHDYETVPALEQGLAAYFHFYNEARLHQSLDYRTPREVYRDPLHQPPTR
jgi:putative transposase